MDLLFIPDLKAAIDFVLQPILIVMLLGTGIFLTIRLGFIQFKGFAHGVAVTMGKYDDVNDPGDVSHFQALTTALSATVGIGNIAGVATAIHFGGPGAVFWMWIIAFLGMATKYTEVILAQRFRKVETGGKGGSVSGGPMYYIEYGLGKKWKPLAIFVAFSLMLTAFLNGNAIQANTMADLMQSEFGIAPWITGIISALLVGAVIMGGINRIGKVTGILAPFMAGLYVLGGLAVLAINYNAILPAFQLILTEAFTPTAGIAGTGAGIFLQTLLWGVRRGMFSNEAGQGSAPIAHSAAKTNEPVSEGVVALLEPFIDTIVICSITALVIVVTGVWNDKTATPIQLNGGDLSFVKRAEKGFEPTQDISNQDIIIQNGSIQEGGATTLHLAWHEVPVEILYLDPTHQTPFSGTIDMAKRLAIGADGQQFTTLYGMAVENGAPLTTLGFNQALGKIGNWIVVLCVLLFGISTAISWSYYGDRCANYLFGSKGVLPYKMVYLGMHFIGAVTALNTVWSWGDTALSFVTIPNVTALLLLSGVAKKMTDAYFEKLKG
ncbi:MAG: alanine/glycine:cation symporter family protein [Saprospiraceae bacterium]